MVGLGRGRKITELELRQDRIGRKDLIPVEGGRMVELRDNLSSGLDVRPRIPPSRRDKLSINLAYGRC